MQKMLQMIAYCAVGVSCATMLVGDEVGKLSKKPTKNLWKIAMCDWVQCGIEWSEKGNYVWTDVFARSLYLKSKWVGKNWYAP